MTTLVINNQVIKPTAGKATQIKIKPEDKIQFLDDNGKPLQNKHAVEAQGEDLIILNEEGQPEFVVSEYQSNSDVAALMLQPPATAGDALLAGEVTAGSGIIAGASLSAGAIAAIGVVAVSGVALAASSGGGSGGVSSTLIHKANNNKATLIPDNNNSDNGENTDTPPIDTPPKLNNDSVKIELVKDSGKADDNITNQGDLKVTGVEGKDWVYSTDNGATWTTGLGDTIPQSILGSDGTHKVLVSLSSDGSNPIETDSYPNIEFELDTKAPEAPKLNTPTYDDKRQVLTVTGTAQEGATVEVTVGEETQTVEATDGTFKVEFEIQQDGKQQKPEISCTATDVADNTSSQAQTTATIPALTNEGVSIQLVKDSGKADDNITNQGDLKVTGVEDKTWVYSLDGENWTAGLGTEISQEDLGKDDKKTVLVSLSPDGSNPIEDNSYPQVAFTLDTDTVAPTVAVSISDTTLTGTITAEAGATIAGTLKIVAPIIGTLPYDLDNYDGNKTVGDDGTITITYNIASIKTFIDAIGIDNITFGYDLTATDIAGNEKTGTAEGQIITQSKSMSMRISASDVLSGVDSLDDLLANIDNSFTQTDTRGATRVATDNTNYDVSYANSNFSNLLDDTIASNSNLI